MIGSSQFKKDVRIVRPPMSIYLMLSKRKVQRRLILSFKYVDILLPHYETEKMIFILLFRKFAADFAFKYKMPPLNWTRCSASIQKFWSGNIHQLRNVAEQISVLETNRDITAAVLQSYLPSEGSTLPSVIKDKKKRERF
jgi:DNA-binding NtrC family response regulator